MTGFQVVSTSPSTCPAAAAYIRPHRIDCQEGSGFIKHKGSTSPNANDYRKEAHGPTVLLVNVSKLLMLSLYNLDVLEMGVTYRMGTGSAAGCSIENNSFVHYMPN
ncbi:hypothetical protein Mp_3g18870 [Marchantia polymorpha subsp. ruderalis]|uniref:Uncharacterized protein n=2 Tax=Marchantia polymorpha TaxID=3197 RepID=A0AAF6B2C3_MARPO|nr:hypothetical protein MARPO_0142s0008 [Marchantia polymorpha]BBN06157.1 hypothetical protein Mp_3g18870 [Marchantia polymorpha subsp. ruderalis]|eukprot:PTQ29377.1 hypothetical protein MARPO_0142s0008 [Marchantia polymorpha]